MPLWRFRSHEEAERHLASLPHSPEGALVTALTLLQLAEGQRLGVRTTRAGLTRYRTIAEAEDEREREAADRLRAFHAGDAPR